MFLAAVFVSHSGKTVSLASRHVLVSDGMYAVWVPGGVVLGVVVLGYRVVGTPGTGYGYTGYCTWPTVLYLPTVLLSWPTVLLSWPYCTTVLALLYCPGPTVLYLAHCTVPGPLYHPAGPLYHPAGPLHHPAGPCTTLPDPIDHPLAAIVTSPGQRLRQPQE